MPIKQKIPERVPCIYCPDLIGGNEPRTVLTSYLSCHMAVAHIDFTGFEKPVQMYSCNGNGINGKLSDCSPGAPIVTLSAISYVEHMKKDHPNEVIPYPIRYKATLCKFMADRCIAKSLHPSTDFPDFPSVVINDMRQKSIDGANVLEQPAHSMDNARNLTTMTGMQDVSDVERSDGNDGGVSSASPAPSVDGG